MHAGTAAPIATSLLIAATLLAAAPARAAECPAPSALAWLQAPVAFIGRVDEVDTAGRARFTVEHLLKGTAPTGPVPPPGCGAGWQRGERWLVAAEASLPLPGPGLTPLQRRDDGPGTIPPAWQRCEADTQCVPLPYGCHATAVARAHADEARQTLWRRHGSPALTDCARRPFEALPAPLCEAGRCGLWGLPPR